jgi:uncharacterized protein YjbI with pentapeptide repeats
VHSRALPVFLNFDWEPSRQASSTGATLQKLISRLDLRGALLKSCEFKNADMTGAQLEGVDFRGSRVEGLMALATDLKGAIVDRAQEMVFAELLGLKIR